MQTLTVSQLNREVKTILEQGVGEVSVVGEISNLVRPASGHFYFTLKDKTAQVRCVFFRGKHLKIHAKLANGQKVCVQGKLSLYEPRGDYQLIVDKLVEDGLGELHRLYEELKAKLQAKGLFAAESKQEIPSFPETIGVITSSSGAAIRDILATLQRRNKLAKVIIYHSDVQGAGSAEQLRAAINKANQDALADVLILARGGGSIEDLWSFNDEKLAYTIAESKIPLVSGVGHEIDFTIADFVADLRAATPTAAAEAVSPDLTEIQAYLLKTQANLLAIMRRNLQNKAVVLRHAQAMLASPKQLIASYWQRLDYLDINLKRQLEKYLFVNERNLQILLAKLNQNNPHVTIKQSLEKFANLKMRLEKSMQEYLQVQRQILNSSLKTLNAVSPLATLDRGYALVMHNNKLIINSTDVKLGDEVKVKLASGQLTCEVKSNE